MVTKTPYTCMSDYIPGRGGEGWKLAKYNYIDQVTLVILIVYQKTERILIF